MARTQGGGRSVTKKGLGERGHEIFTSHTYTSPNTLSSGLPTCWGGARRRRVSKRTRQEHANYTQCRRKGHAAAPGLRSRWPEVRAHLCGAGSCQLLWAALRPTNGLATSSPVLSRTNDTATSSPVPQLEHAAGPPGSARGWRSWGTVSPQHGRPAPCSPLPFSSTCRSLNLNEGLTDGRAASASL